MNVTSLAETLGQEQSMVSHNLKALERCAFVSSERRGKEKVYSINPETVEGIFKVVENHATNHCPSRGTCQDSN